MKNHKFKFDRQSKILFDYEEKIIDVYKCIDCEGIRIIDSKTGKELSLDGEIGEEI